MNRIARFAFWVFGVTLGSLGSLATTGCHSVKTPRPSTIRVATKDEHHFHTITQTADLRSIHVITKAGKTYFLAEPPPDAAFSYEDASDLSFALVGRSGSTDARDGSEDEPLTGRAAYVLLARDLNYRLAEATINFGLTNEEYQKLYRENLEVIRMVAERESRTLHQSQILLSNGSDVATLNPFPISDPPQPLVADGGGSDSNGSGGSSKKTDDTNKTGGGKDPDDKPSNGGDTPDHGSTNGGGGTTGGDQGELADFMHQTATGIVGRTFLVAPDTTELAPTGTSFVTYAPTDLVIAQTAYSGPSSEAQASTTFQELQSALGVGGSVSGHYGGFKAKVSVEDAQAKSQTQFQSYASVAKVIANVDVVLTPAAQKKLEDALRAQIGDQVKRLGAPSDQNLSAYSNLFRKVGTHYCPAVTFGGRMDMIAWSNDSSSASASDLKVAVQASYEGSGAGGEVDANVDRSHSEVLNKSGVGSSVVSVGGSAAKSSEILTYTKDDYKAWAESVNSTNTLTEGPAIIAHELNGVWEVLDGAERDHLESAYSKAYPRTASKTQVVQPPQLVVRPGLDEGDREFDGHGPRMQISVSLRLNPENKGLIEYGAYMIAEEWDDDKDERTGDKSRAVGGSHWQKLHEVEKGQRITSVRVPGFDVDGKAAVTYPPTPFINVDTSHDKLTLTGEDVAPLKIVKSLALVGDIKGKDIGTTGMTIDFNPIEIVVE